MDAPLCVAARSEYFRKLFSTSVGAICATTASTSSSDRVITLRLTDFDLPTRFDPQTFRDIVTWCYTNGDDLTSIAAAWKFHRSSQCHALTRQLTH